jgi:hypothetical protein
MKHQDVVQPRARQRSAGFFFSSLCEALNAD